MKKIRITAHNFMWGCTKYPKDTEQYFHPHVAEAIIKRGAGETVDEPAPEPEPEPAKTEDQPVPPKPRRRRTYRRRDMQADK